MTLDEAVALIQQGLGFRTDLVEPIKFALLEAQTEFEGPNRTLPTFLIQEDQPLAVLATVQSVALPSGFIRSVEGEGPNYAGATGQVFLRKLMKEEADAFFFNTDPGTPQAYVKRLSALRIYPVPDINYTLTWSYFKSDPLPASGGSTNSWLTKWPWLLVGRAGMIISQDTRQNDSQNSAYAKFKEQFDKWNTVWMASLPGAEDDNMPRAMGLNN